MVQMINVLTNISGVFLEAAKTGSIDKNNNGLKHINNTNKIRELRANKI